MNKEKVPKGMALIKNKIAILVSIPITLVFIIAIISQYIALQYTREQNDQMQDNLFQTQIMFSKLFTQQISNQLSQEMQKIPYFTTLLNQYLSKIVNEQVLFNESYKTNMVHLEMLYQGKVDPKIIETFKRSSLLINCWFHMNYTSFDQLDQKGLQKLNFIDRLVPLQRAIEYEGNIKDAWSNKRLKINDILQTFQYKGLYTISGLNSTLKNQPKIPKCDSGIDPRCRFWYQETAVQDTVQIFQPNFIYVTKEPSLASLGCQKLQVYNQNTNLNELESVLCLDLRFSHTQNYFKNFANSTKQIYFIEPQSQILLFNSKQSLGVTSIEKLQNEEFQYLESQQEAKNFNDTLKIFYSNTVFKNINQINIKEIEDINSYNQTFSYIRNGTKTEVIMNPVYIIDKLPQFYGVKVSTSREKYQIKIPYVQINIISNEELMDDAKKIEEFFNKYFLYFNLTFGIVGFFSILIIAFYSNIIKNMFNESIDHLTKVIVKMTDQQLSQDIFDQINDNFFLSQETHQLYESFKQIYQILLYASENFFSENETEKLLKLNRNIEFFQQFGNNQAVGITYNNIGSILLSQGHYFQALEHFSTSIIYARYEIQDFCYTYPTSISSSLLADFCFTKVTELSFNGIQNNPKIRASSLQIKKNSSLFCQQVNKEQEQDSKTNEEKAQFTTHKISTAKKFSQSQNEKKTTLVSDQYQYDDLYEDRIQLLQNLFSRKKNYLTTLQAFQENFDSQNSAFPTIKSFNFWKEIKNLSKKLLILSKQLPQSDIYQVELNALISKCYFKLKEEQKSKIKFSICRNYLMSMSPVLQKQEYDMNLSWKNKQITSVAEKSKPNEFVAKSLVKKQEQNKEEGFSYRNIMKSPVLLSVNQSSKQKHPFYQYDNVKEDEEVNKSTIIHNSTINPLLNQNSNFNMRNNRISQFQIKNSFLQESIIKSPLQRLTTSIQTTPTKRHTNFVQVQNKRDIETIFESQRKLESSNQVQTFLNSYLSKDTLDLIISFTEVESLIDQQQYQKAALILTELLEEKKQIISHYNFKIVDKLKYIFDKEKKNSRELNQMRQKFNPDIKISIQMIFACQENNKQILKSVQLASNLVSTILVQDFDQFGVTLVEKSDNFIQTLVTLTKTSQIKQVMKNIIEEVLNKTSYSKTQELIDQFNELEQEQELLTTENNKEEYKHKTFRQSQKLEDVKLKYFYEEKIEKDYFEPIFISLNNNEQNTLSKNLNSIEFSLFTKYDTNLQTVNLLQPNSNKTPKLRQHIGDEQISMQTIGLSQSLTLIEESRKEQFIDRNSLFHITIRKTLNEIFEKQIQYQIESTKDYQELLSLSQIDGINTEQFINNNVSTLQFKFIIYCTDQIQILKNNMFESLCKVLLRWNIKLIIYTLQRGNNFLEQQPDLVYSYQSRNIIRIFYSNQKMINYLQNCRNVFSRSVFPTIIQHF